MHYWLMKSEPTTFSQFRILHSKNKTTCWEGVRNYQARNFLRAMKKGDRAIFYHSNAKPPAAVGIVEVVKEFYPDHFAWKEGHKYQDIKASPEKPIWSMVDVKLIQIFPQEISLEQLRGVKALEGLELLRRGSRLSVHPVSAAHFKVFERLAKQK